MVRLNTVQRLYFSYIFCFQSGKYEILKAGLGNQKNIQEKYFFLLFYIRAHVERSSLTTSTTKWSLWAQYKI
jgi:hypothetical protein